MTERILRVKDMSFDAAHYIPGHPKCGVIHGHTYFVNIELVYEGTPETFVDIGEVKEIVKGWDHKLIIPIEHSEFWLHLSTETPKKINCRIPYRAIHGSPIVENIAEAIAEEIKQIPRVLSARVEVREGPNQGTVYET